MCVCVCVCIINIIEFSPSGIAAEKGPSSLSPFNSGVSKLISSFAALFAAVIAKWEFIYLNRHVGDHPIVYIS